MATLYKFKLLATQCGVAPSPTRSPRTSPIVHLRRSSRPRTTLRALLTRSSSSSSFRRRPPPPSPPPIPHEKKRDTLKDLFVSSPPPNAVGREGGKSCEMFRMKVIPGSELGSTRPGWTGFRHRVMLRRSWRPMLVGIPEEE